MSVKSFDSFFAAFKKEYEKVVGEMKPYHAFTAFCAKYFYYSDSSEDLEEDFKKCMPDGANDGGIDAVFANPLESTKELVVLQGKFYKKSTLGLQELKTELNKIIDTLNDLKAHKQGNLNADVSAAYYTAIDDLDEDFSVHIDFCTLAKLTNPVLKQMQKACSEREGKTGYHIRLLTYEDILRRVVSATTASETVAKDTLKTDAAGNALKYQDSVVVNISAQSLQRVYKIHQTKVLGRNLRYHIKSGTGAAAVDNAISKTISEEPTNFWFLNNGILITCDDFELNGTDLKLVNFSIVNGGQTTFKVAKAKDLSKDFFIQCKVVKMHGGDEDERRRFSLKIANATNSQKPIKQADLRSNEPEQLILKKQLSTLNFYYVTKAGDKPEKKIYRNYQIANLDKVGKASLAGVLLMPGTSRSGAAKMFDEDIYRAIFHNSRPNVITDLLTLTYWFKIFQRNAIAKADELGFNDLDKLPVLKNGEKFYLACIAFLAKVKAGVFKHSDVVSARSSGTDDVRKLLWKMGDMDKIVGVKSAEVQEKSRVVFTLLTKKVLAPCCRVSRKASEQGGHTFVHTNYLKKDVSFYEDVIDELWSQYTDDEAFKEAIDGLIV